MTNKALGIACRCLVLVISAETFRVREGLQVPGVADRHRSALGVDVAGLAVGHFEMRHQLLFSIVTSHTVQHLGMIEIRQALTVSDPIMTSDTRKMLFTPVSQMGQVGEFQIHRHS